jgi:23S rRNA (uracil1939-C5)-methyltransferase
MGKQKRKVEATTGRRRLTAGKSAEVSIERLLPGGLGLAHAEGQTILVALAAPGDRLHVMIERVRGDVAFGSIHEIVTPSPLRVEPLCPYFGRCGGCDFQQLSYQAQLAAKVEIIRDCLRRIARIEPPSDITITPSPLAWNYRSRAQWQHDARRRHLGYFERGSHRVCDVTVCPVLVPALQETFSDLRERMLSGLLPPDIEEFQGVAGDDGASLVPPLDAVEERLETSRTIGDHRYRFSADGFFQINHELLAPLINAAVNQAHGDTAIDLYCGAGLFTLPLARRFARVIGVEANAAAIAYARRNLDEAGLTGATVERAKVSDWLKDNAERLAPVDYLLLDPPRAGAEEGATAGILSLRPRHIAYVSCDPATLARDLKELFGGGYRLDSITAFDMFPQTHHVETVVHMRK